MKRRQIRKFRYNSQVTPLSGALRCVLSLRAEVSALARCSSGTSVAEMYSLILRRHMSDAMWARFWFYYVVKAAVSCGHESARPTTCSVVDK